MTRHFWLSVFIYDLWVGWCYCTDIKRDIWTTYNFTVAEDIPIDIPSLQDYKCIPKGVTVALTMRKGPGRDFFNNSFRHENLEWWRDIDTDISLGPFQNVCFAFDRFFMSHDLVLFFIHYSATFPSPVIHLMLSYLG